MTTDPTSADTGPPEDAPSGGATNARDARRSAQALAFDRIGARYDEAFPHKQEQLAAGEWLAARLEPGSRVLDVGCGTGMPTARQLVDAGLRVTGIDISAGMLDLARAAVPEASFHQADVMDLDETWGHFDGVVAFFSLLMLPRRQIMAALRLLHGLLTPAGLLMLAMVEADLDDVELPFLGSPVRLTGYPHDQLRAVVEATGFEVVEQRHRTYAPEHEDTPAETQQFLYCRRGTQAAPNRSSIT
ncbi:class I SAM-dependent DNA methyltransferase [Actinopolymorpha pittospori]|uniref:Ubiquinone/menaquinone biosynthesis C-methylase UbiE n=1 Tax=Actinopolymorpha pittospori TaxID=648752 RepID=A0A927N2C8_9ACTN|nr:class I SAM-dependent methyltransferase [Actinopolymorpha pittospori]MBE1609683.1 ubiquinone/menaquinone biosynthesis C-methylase UbiE [Actinopolymorpha pittospori]